MDVRIAGSVDGIEAAFQAKAEFDIPVIYLSAYSDPDTLRRAALTMPEAYLLKPFDEKELGSLEEGKAADLVVWNKDLTAIKSPRDVEGLSVQATYVAGKAVYQAAGASGL